MNEREALAELVALKDLKDRLHKLHEMGHGTDYDDYHRRQPLAWAAARAALAQPAASEPLTEPELPQPSLLVESAQGFVEGWTRSQVRSAINLALLKQRYSQPPREPLTDARIAELEEAMWYIKMNAGRGDLVYAKARAILAAAQEGKP